MLSSQSDPLDRRYVVDPKTAFGQFHHRLLFDHISDSAGAMEGIPDVSDPDYRLYLVMLYYFQSTGKEILDEIKRVDETSLEKVLQQEESDPLLLKSLKDKLSKLFSYNQDSLLSKPSQSNNPIFYFYKLIISGIEFRMLENPNAWVADRGRVDISSIIFKEKKEDITEEEQEQVKRQLIAHEIASKITEIYKTDLISLLENGRKQYSEKFLIFFLAKTILADDVTIKDPSNLFAEKMVGLANHTNKSLKGIKLPFPISFKSKTLTVDRLKAYKKSHFKQELLKFFDIEVRGSSCREVEYKHEEVYMGEIEEKKPVVHEVNSDCLPLDESSAYPREEPGEPPLLLSSIFATKGKGKGKGGGGNTESTTEVSTNTRTSETVSYQPKELYMGWVDGGDDSKTTNNDFPPGAPMPLSMFATNKISSGYYPAEWSTDNSLTTNSSEYSLSPNEDEEDEEDEGSKSFISNVTGLEEGADHAPLLLSQAFPSPCSSSGSGST